MAPQQLGKLSQGCFKSTLARKVSSLWGIAHLYFKASIITRSCPDGALLAGGFKLPSPGVFSRGSVSSSLGKGYPGQNAG